MARLKEKYRGEIVPRLMEICEYKNIMQVPRLEKVVLNIGLGEANANAKALEAAEQAVKGVRTVPHVVGKFASSGTKIGGKRYKDAIATTNDLYCPCLAQNEGSKIPEGVECVYEVIASGLRLENVKKAMKVGIENATKVHGVLKITATNYGGTLGKGKIFLRSLFNSKAETHATNHSS